MTGLLVVGIGVLLTLGVIVVGAVSLDPDARAHRAEQQVIRGARRADAQVGRVAHEARRAMNTAAGQSWRNPFA